MNWNLLMCALFEKHNLDKFVRLDDTKGERYCIYCRHKVVIYRSKVDEHKRDIIRYIQDDSFYHARMAIDNLIEVMEEDE